MRIDGWSIAAFGPLTQWHATNLERHNILVVLGPNESGKSALFEFFASALFGFTPARADRHPYQPWDGRYPEGRLDVVLRDGSRARLARRLASRPEGQVTVNDDTQGLANHAAPWIGLMNRDVFKNVYALTQEEALQLDHQAWRQVQDRVLGGSSYDFLRPSRQVADALDAERARLWRPDRRGKPKAQKIAAAALQLRKSLPEAGSRRERIEAANQRLGEIEAEFSENTRELQRIELALERDATLAPLVRRVQHMETLGAQANALVPAGTLPDNVSHQRAELVERLDELREMQARLQQDIQQRQDMLDINDPTRRVLDARKVIEHLGDDLSRAREDQARMENMDAELQRNTGALYELAAPTLTSEQMDAAAHAALLGLSVIELRGQFAVWQESRHRFTAARDHLERMKAEQKEVHRAIAEREPALKLDAATRGLLDARDDIERLDRDLSRAQENQSHIASMDADLQRGDGALRELASRTLTSDHVDEAVRAAILAISVPEVRGRFAAWRAARQQLDGAAAAADGARSERVRLEGELEAGEAERSLAELDERLRDLRQVERARALAPESAAAPFTPWPALAAAVAAIGAPALGGAFAAPVGVLVAIAVVGVLVVIGAVVTTRRAAHRRARTVTTEWETRLQRLGLDPASDLDAEIQRTQAGRDTALGREDTVGQAARARDVETKARAQAQASKAAAQTARGEFHAAIAHVPVAPIQRETLDEGLVRDLEEMRQAIENAQRLRRNRDEVAARLAAWRGEVERLAPRLGMDLPADPFQAAPTARRALLHALDVERAARTAEAEILRLRQQLEASAPDLDTAEAKLAKSQLSMRRAHGEFLALLAHIPVAQVQSESPDEGLVRDLEEMHRLVTGMTRLRGNRDDVATRLDAWSGEVEHLRQTLQHDLPADPFEAAPAARRALPGALEVERAARAAEAELPALLRCLEACNQDRDSAALELEQLDSRLASLDSNQADPLAGLDQVDQALSLRDEARRIHAELERDALGWSDRISEAHELAASGETIGLSDAERVNRRLRRDELQAQGQDLADERGRLAAEREQLTRLPGPAHIMGAIEAANEKLNLVRRQHDQLALLRQVILMAEHSYRERYQAPLLTAAGRHLRRFTNERYDLLTVDDAASAEVELQVRRAGEDFPQTVERPLSRGTIQQIYFALRLAMVDLVEGDEPLPLFLDEMFVNWDPSRTSSGLDALAALPGDRQVFLFTADPFWADRAVADVPAAHIMHTPAFA